MQIEIVKREEQSKRMDGKYLGWIPFDAEMPSKVVVDQLLMNYFITNGKGSGCFLFLVMLFKRV